MVCMLQRSSPLGTSVMGAAGSLCIHLACLLHSELFLCERTSSFLFNALHAQHQWRPGISAMPAEQTEQTCIRLRDARGNFIFSGKARVPDSRQACVLELQRGLCTEPALKSTCNATRAESAPTELPAFRCNCRH